MWDRLSSIGSVVWGPVVFLQASGMSGCVVCYYYTSVSEEPACVRSETSIYCQIAIFNKLPKTPPFCTFFPSHISTFRFFIFFLIVLFYLFLPFFLPVWRHVMAPPTLPNLCCSIPSFVVSVIPACSLVRLSLARSPLAVGACSARSLVALYGTRSCAIRQPPCRPLRKIRYCGCCRNLAAPAYLEVFGLACL